MVVGHPMHFGNIFVLPYWARQNVDAEGGGKGGLYKGSVSNLPIRWGPHFRKCSSQIGYIMSSPLCNKHHHLAMFNSVT